MVKTVLESLIRINGERAKRNRIRVQAERGSKHRQLCMKVSTLPALLVVPHALQTARTRRLLRRGRYLGQHVLNFVNGYETHVVG
jgi:hypothetical protein